MIRERTKTTMNVTCGRNERLNDQVPYGATKGAEGRTKGTSGHCVDEELRRRVKVTSRIRRAAQRAKDWV
jgi:hypothetical protein